MWLVAAWFSIPRDLVDTLFFNHNYGRYYLSAFSMLCLLVFALVSIWIVFASARWAQKLSAVLVAICCLTALYTRNLSLEMPANQHLFKKLIALWAMAMAIGLADWIFFQRYRHGAQKASLSDIDTLPGFNVFSARMDSPEDKARSQIFNRLRDQAQAEGFDLTDIDFMMIDYSRIASSDLARPLEETFYSTRDYWAFKEKIIYILANAIRGDADQDVSAMKNYKRLRKDLRRGRRDQQLVAYLAPAILGARSQAQKALEFSIYAAIGCGVVVALVFIAIHYL